MRSEFLALTLVALAGCGAKSTAVCAPVASWSLPAVACAAPVVAVVEPEPEPPAPEPEPEPPPPPVEVIADTIELRDTVQFETGEAVLLAASEQLLDEVAKILADHPDLVALVLQVVFAASLVTLAYGLCLRWFGRERLDNFITAAQVMVTGLKLRVIITAPVTSA